MMKTCRKCGGNLFSHNYSMCDTCEGAGIIAVITSVSDERHKTMNQGGKREGAGRKPSPVGTTKEVYNTKLTPEVVEFRRQCDNAAETIDDTLRRSKAFRDWSKSR